MRVRPPLPSQKLSPKSKARDLNKLRNTDVQHLVIRHFSSAHSRQSSPVVQSLTSVTSACFCCQMKEKAHGRVLAGPFTCDGPMPPFFCRGPVSGDCLVHRLDGDLQVSLGLPPEAPACPTAKKTQTQPDPL